MLTQLSPDSISGEIDAWIVRLNRLYETLDRWMEPIPHDRIERGMVRQQVEPLMRRFNIAPRKVPTYSIVQGECRTAFMPSALWVPASKGRVDITTNHAQYVLVAPKESDNGGKWELMTDDFDHLAVPFNKARLIGILTGKQ